MKLICVFIIILNFLTFSKIFASEDIPLDSWIYNDITKLEAYGVISPYSVHLKPYSRKEIAEVLSTISINSSNKMPHEILSIIKKLQKEFQNDNQKTNEESLKIKEINIYYLNASDSSSVYNDLETSYYYSDYPNRKNLGNYKNYKGNNTWIKLNIFGNYYDKLEITYRPVLIRNDEKNNFNSKNNEYFIKFFNDKLELILGKENIYWGPGVHSALLISDNAPAREMIQFKNNSPIDPPSIFSILGKMKFHFFFSNLNDDRLVPNTYFSGLKLNFIPSGRFEYGFSKVVFSGGDGEYQGQKFKKPTTLDIIADVISIIPRELRGKGKEDPINDSNQIAGIDFRLKIPEWNLILYTEYMQEDYRLSLKEFLKTGPDDRASIIGLYWIIPYDNYLSNLYVEYATTTEPWYKHGKYTDGYIYEHKIIGHHMGSDADDLWISISRNFEDSFKLTYSYDIERQGIRTQVNTSKNIQQNIDLDYNFSEQISSKFSYATYELKTDNDKNENHNIGINFLYKF